MLENDKMTDSKNVIYFGNLKSRCGGVVHTGDNLTGEGDGDDEQILIDLAKVPAQINKLVFVVNIYDCVRRKQDFGSRFPPRSGSFCLNSYLLNCKSPVLRD